MSKSATFLKNLARYLEALARQERSFVVTVVGIAAGFLAMVAYGLQTQTFAQFTAVVSLAFMIACAALLSGGLVGFLFGIPRTLQQGQAERPMPDTESTDASQENSQNVHYQTNTNLEQISDWLTKILVGVGLTQISSLSKTLQAYADHTAVGLGSFPSSSAFSLALLFYFSIGGFLIGYLLTRLRLLAALVRADFAARLKKAEHEVSEYQKQAAADAKALWVVQHQLNPAPGISPVTQGEITAAIQQASPQARARCFYIAQEVRSENWRELRTKPKMERTIPIFRALIASDTDNVYHRNHGQLGYALRDQRNPDWKEAETELTKAIELRGECKELGWLHYEFVRAICRMNLDQAFGRRKPGNAETRKSILDDLRAAAQNPFLSQQIEADPTITEWMTINEVDMDEITEHDE